MPRGFLALSWLLAAACGTGTSRDASALAEEQGWIVVLQPPGLGSDVLQPPEVVQRGDVAHLEALVHQLVEQYPARVERTFDTVLRGFSARMALGTALALSADPRVAYLEKDVPLRACGEVQRDAPWGLDRIDQQPPALDGSYAWEHDGAGVTVFVLDTGLRTTHVDFEGRAAVAHDVFGGDGHDTHGHGTQVASVAGGRTFGVAKGVRLLGVKVLGDDGVGSASSLLAGLEWIACTQGGARPAVVSLALSGQRRRCLDEALGALQRAGLVVVAAAGNDAQDVRLVSPAGQPDVIAVAASDRDDARWALSNFGERVLFAPGVLVPAAGAAHDAQGLAATGTSLAAAHVSGVVARYLALYPASRQADVAELGLRRNMSIACIADAQGPANHLVYSGFRAGQIEQIDESFVRGWVWDPSRPGDPLAVTIIAHLPGEARELATVRAAEFRDDLAANGLGDGAHGFRFRVPADLRGDPRIELSVVVAGANYQLVDARGRERLAVAPGAR